jgi:hypothetical protein
LMKLLRHSGRFTFWNVANSGKTRMRLQAEQLRGTCPSSTAGTGR